ncbi:dihydroorotase [Rubrivirga marina]|uniref:Dihydroorotase n=1 Tax=Rubrivirga marina TaxID=1196024 RepID=A0A271J2S0_9BACT|nr:dihydroorotase [Rubrivirga marina]PAP77792.1 dihydroorotase [Rubrivirga marina]
MPLDLLLADGTVLDARTGTSRRADVLIRDGRIARLGESLREAAEADGVLVYDASGKTISQGWMDMHVHFREPGQEHKETIETGARAAAFGGFTAVACMPNTEPPIATRDVVEFVTKRAEGLVVDVHPIGTVSKGRKGEELAEMADMAAGGAVGFSDDGSPVQHGGLMRRALEYARTLGKPILGHEEDLTLNPHGHMNEGAVATRLGLPGIPGLAEEAMIARDALLAEFTGARFHVCHISTATAVDIVRRAKARGVQITAEACPHHWALTDAAVEASAYDTHTKMHPPLRTAADVQAIKDGLADGTIDAIATDHAPHAGFEKEVEFIEAPFGILGLETCWGLTGRDLIAPGVLSVEDAVRKLAVAPREILGLDVPTLDEGAEANLTLFDATTEWTFERRHVRSKSHNTPFIGAPMVGRAWAVVNNGQFVEAEA